MNSSSSGDIPEKKTTDELLRELFGLIQLTQNPPQKPDTWLEKRRLQRYEAYWGTERTIPAQIINDLRKHAMTGIQR